MDLKEAHRVVKGINPGKDKYLSVVSITKVLLGHQTKPVLSQLNFNDRIFLGLRMKGDIKDYRKWKIEHTDAIDFALRISDYAEKLDLDEHPS